MTVPAKISVILLLSLGIFASVATLIRLKFLADLNDLDDILFAGTDAMVWTLVEPGVAIVAASLVTIRPLLRLFRLHGFESTGRTPGPSGTARIGRSEILWVVRNIEHQIQSSTVTYVTPEYVAI
ncbi:hypothetical protein ACHAP9_005559 [Verticillium nonalfalfae]